MAATCPQAEQLLHAYGEAVQELILFQEQHFLALMQGDEDSSRFEVLIHLAGERRQNAKYAYLLHLQQHRCERGAVEAVAELIASNHGRAERRKRADPANKFRRRSTDALSGESDGL
jgi:hypothetical protein